MTISMKINKQTSFVQHTEVHLFIHKSFAGVRTFLRPSTVHLGINRVWTSLYVASAVKTWVQRVYQRRRQRCILTAALHCTFSRILSSIPSRDSCLYLAPFAFRAPVLICTVPLRVQPSAGLYRNTSHASKPACRNAKPQRSVATERYIAIRLIGCKHGHRRVPSQTPSWW